MSNATWHLGRHLAARIRATAHQHGAQARGSAHGGGAGGGVPRRAADPRPDLDDAFEAERQRISAARLPTGVILFLAALFLVDVAEWVRYPHRLSAILAVSSVQVACCALGLLAMQRRVLRPSSASVAVFAAVGSLMSAYNGWLHGSGDRLAVAHVCILTAYAVLQVPTLLEQTILVAVTVVGYLAVAPFLAGIDAVSFPIVGLLGAAAASLVAAEYLGRYAHTAFVRSRLHQEEAEIASVLLRVGETLQARLDRPGVLDEVNRLAVEVLGCDWSTTYVFEEEGAILRLVASHGVPADRLDDSQRVYAAAFATLVERAGTPDGLIELVGEEVVFAWPDGRRRSIGRPSILQALMMHDDEPIGLFGIGMEREGHQFGVRERRIVRGIAHAVAVAICNMRLLEVVQAASRLKSDFVATMSHELRTPINVIIGYLDMLGDRELGMLSAFQQGLVETSRTSAIELLDLVNDTLALNRLESGRESVEAVEFDLEELFAEIAREVCALVPAQVTLVWRMHLGSALVGTDRPKLKTVVKNLVGNALKFTARGSVEVIAGATDDTLVLQVRDTGAGIAPDDLPIIFEMFRQGRMTTGRGGVGLGLHIVQRLVTLLGGSVRAESVLGEGTTFVVRLPGAVRAEPAAAMG